jgi:dTDP-4-amino-4,6-dideoxygalactose transaminase
MAESLLEREGDDVAGILLTNTFGTPNAAIEKWEALAHRFGVALVIDSAPGFASAYEWGEPLGARGNCEIFSFHATKTVAIGEGGAIASRDHDFISQINQLKNFGFDDHRRSLGIGLNGKLAEFGSAMGLRQLESLADRMVRRREVLGWYLSGLKPLGCDFQTGVTLAAPPFVSIALESGSQRDQVGAALERADVGWRAYYNPPIHCQPSFEGVRVTGDLVVTEDVSRRIISLPLDERLSSCDVDRVVDVVRNVVD